MIQPSHINIDNLNASEQTIILFDSFNLLQNLYRNYQQQRKRTVTHNNSNSKMRQTNKKQQHLLLKRFSFVEIPPNILLLPTIITFRFTRLSVFKRFTFTRIIQEKEFGLQTNVSDHQLNTFWIKK